MCLDLLSLCEYGMSLKSAFFITKMPELMLQHKSNAN